MKTKLLSFNFQVIILLMILNTTIISSCGDKLIGDKEKGFIDRIDLNEIYEFKFHNPILLDLELNEFGIQNEPSNNELKKRYFYLKTANDFFDQAYINKDDNVEKSESFFDSSIVYYEKSYLDGGISTGIGNLISAKILLRKENEAIEELLILESNKLKSIDFEAVYYDYNMKKIQFLLGICYLKKYELENAKIHEAKLKDLIDNDKFKSEADEYDYLILSSLIKILSKEEKSCEYLNNNITRLDSIINSNSENTSLIILHEMATGCKKKNTFLKSLYNNFCLIDKNK